MSGAVEGRAHEAEDLVGEAWDACPVEEGGQVSRARLGGSAGAVGVGFGVRADHLDQ
jgi:hypothetical protein